MFDFKKQEEANILRLRLERGYAQIKQAEDKGTDTSKWVEFWENLLREYEEVCAELDEETK